MPRHGRASCRRERDEERRAARDFKVRSRGPSLEPVTVSRSKSIKIPDGICLKCFNSQQQFAFPFLVYCPHSERLALVRSADDSATFPCKPAQLPHVLAKLANAKGDANAVSRSCD